MPEEPPAAVAFPDAGAQGIPHIRRAIDQAHPTMTDEIPRLVAHGKLTVKPDIASLDGSRADWGEVRAFARGRSLILSFNVGPERKPEPRAS